MPKELGGGGMTMLQQTLVSEQLGRVTNALGWCVHTPPAWAPAVVTPEQLERWIEPDDPRRATRVLRDHGGGRRLRRRRDRIDRPARRRRVRVERRQDARDVVQHRELRRSSRARSSTASTRASTRCSSSTTTRRASAWCACRATRTRTPISIRSWRSRTCASPRRTSIGREGDGLAFTYEWFRYERLMIAARCCGAAERLIEEATAFAKERVQFGRPIIENQAIAHMLADSLTELWAARLMTYRLAENIDAGHDVKLQHTQCSMAKLYASEMAGTGRRPRGADLRRSRLHARERGGALLARAARRSDLGGNVRDPTQHRRRPAGQARRARSARRQPAPREIVTVGHRSADAVPWSLTTEMAARPPPMRDGVRPDRVTGAPEGSGTAGSV